MRQIDEVVAANRSEVVEAIEGRKAEIEASAFYAKATPDAQESVLRRVDQVITRVRVEKQIALIRELGSSFEETVYPGLLDQLAAAQQDGDDGDGGTPPSEADRVGQDHLGYWRQRGAGDRGGR